jgi:diguanylate cyclase
MSRSLDFVVSSVGAQLMHATAFTAAKVSQQVLANLVEQFDVDAAFLRHNDHNIRASKLVAEWPPRPERPDPDLS